MNHKLFRICNIPKSRRQKEFYMDKSMRIAVVYGGTSTERVPSLKGGHAVYEALQRSGFTNPILFDLQNHNIDRVLPEVELVSDAMYRSYEVKYTSGFSKHVIPARIPETTRTRIHEIGKKLYREFGCRGCARIDFIVDSRKGPAVLEINTLPAMTSTSALPASAKAAGISFEELVIRMISYGLQNTAY